MNRNNKVKCKCAGAKATQTEVGTGGGTTLREQTQAAARKLVPPRPPHTPQELIFTVLKPHLKKFVCAAANLRGFSFPFKF